MPVFSSSVSEPLLAACMILVDPRLWNCCIILHGPSISQQYTNTIWQKFVYFILLYEYYLLSIVYIHIQQIKYTIACMTNKRNWCFHYALRGGNSNLNSSWVRLSWAVQNRTNPAGDFHNMHTIVKQSPGVFLISASWKACKL